MSDEPPAPVPSDALCFYLAVGVTLGSDGTCPGPSTHLVSAYTNLVCEIGSEMPSIGAASCSVAVSSSAENELLQMQTGAAWQAGDVVQVLNSALAALVTVYRGSVLVRNPRVWP